MARHLQAAGLSSILFAICGATNLSSYLTSILTQDLSDCEIIPVGREGDTGVACILYLDGKDSRRLVLGPKKSSIDLIRYAEIREQLISYAPRIRGLFLDGYLLWNHAATWVSDIENMARDGWQLHLELVPHSIWRNLNEHLFLRLRGACYSISSPISTVERIFGLQPDDRVDDLSRVSRLCECVGDRHGPGARLHLRWGKRNAEFCFILEGTGSGILWRYVPASYSMPSSNQDRLYILETVGRVPSAWRIAVAKIAAPNR